MQTHSVEFSLGRTALVVDDELVVRNLLRRCLERRGWAVLEADTAERALEMLGGLRAQLDIILCDLNLPGLSGTALCRRIGETRPELSTRLVLTSGDPGTAVAELARESLHCPVLGKPFAISDLDRLIDDMVCVA